MTGGNFKYTAPCQQILFCPWKEVIDYGLLLGISDNSEIQGYKFCTFRTGLKNPVNKYGL